jgi:hypothetical protein
MPGGAWKPDDPSLSLLSCPALTTDVGRVARPAPAGEPGCVEPGRLSPRMLLMKLLTSVLCVGVGESTWRVVSVYGCVQGSCRTSPRGLELCAWRLAVSAFLSSRWRFSSASLAFFARISSRRCCIVDSMAEMRSGMFGGVRVAVGRSLSGARLDSTGWVRAGRGLGLFALALINFPPG